MLLRLYRVFAALIGFHVCGPFTKWDQHEGTFLMNVPLWESPDRVKYTARWQERRCEVCGKIQQRKLSVDG